MNLDKIKEFYYVAKAGNITKAALELNISQPAISRTIQIFEYQTGCKLFVRCAKGMKLTPEGEKVYEFAYRIIEEAKLLGKTIRTNALEGDVAIALSPYLSGSWLIRKLKNYFPMHSDIKLKVLDHVDAPNPNDIDVMIGFDVVFTRDAIKHVLLKSNMGLFASSAYLEKFGAPQNLKDLDRHFIISYSEHHKLPYKEKDPWALKIGKDYGHYRQPHLRVSSLDGLLSAACDNLGIVELPCDLTEIKEKGLIAVLPDLRGPEIEISFVYPQELKERANIRSLREYLLMGQ